MENIRVIKVILRAFELVSGLKINFAKSSFGAIGMPDLFQFTFCLFSGLLEGWWISWFAYKEGFFGVEVWINTRSLGSNGNRSAFQKPKEDWESRTSTHLILHC